MVIGLILTMMVWQSIISRVYYVGKSTYIVRLKMKMTKWENVPFFRFYGFSDFVELNKIFWIQWKIIYSNIMDVKVENVHFVVRYTVAGK